MKKHESNDFFLKASWLLGVRVGAGWEGSPGRHERVWSNLGCMVHSQGARYIKQPHHVPTSHYCHLMWWIFHEVDVKGG